MTDETINSPSLPDDQDVQQWAMQAMHAGQWQQALKRWSLLRQHYPNLAPAWVQAAVAHIHLKQNQEAKALLIQAEEKFPDNANILIQRINIASNTAQWDEAWNYANALQKLQPNAIIGQIKPTELAIKQQRFELADKLNGEARQVFPNEVQLWHQYINIALLQSNQQESQKRCDEMLERFPDNQDCYRFAAKVAEQLNDHKNAKRFRRAVDYGSQWLSDTETTADKTVELIRPPSKRSLGNFLELVWTKARLNLKSEASSNYLSYLWWIIDPLLYLSVYYVVFSLLLDRGGDGFVSFLLVGLIPYQWFSKTIQSCAGSIIGGRGLMNQVHLSPLFFPLVTITQNLGKQLLIFVLLFSFLPWYSASPSIEWLSILLIILIQLVFISSLGTLLALIIPFSRDLLKLVPTALQFMMFISGIFFQADRIPEQWQPLFYSNPLASLLKEYRHVIFDNQWPDWHYLSIPLIYTLASIIVISIIYKKVETTYPRLVL